MADLPDVTTTGSHHSKRTGQPAVRTPTAFCDPFDRVADSRLSPIWMVMSHVTFDPYLRYASLRDSEAVAAAEAVGLSAGALAYYPHELSGGVAQRAVTALALVGEPAFVLADEPTTGLDAPMARRTLDELRRLTDAGRGVLMITHDLDAAARIADSLAVMYAGRIVEQGPVADVFATPHHPYTRGLLNALPRNGFRPIPGLPPQLSALPAGCAFAARCDRADDDWAVRPELLVHNGRGVACHRPC